MFADKPRTAWPGLSPGKSPIREKHATTLTGASAAQVRTGPIPATCCVPCPNYVMCTSAAEPAHLAGGSVEQGGRLLAQAAGSQGSGLVGEAVGLRHGRVVEQLRKFGRVIWLFNRALTCERCRSPTRRQLLAAGTHFRGQTLSARVKHESSRPRAARGPTDMLDWMLRNDQWFARTWNILWRRQGIHTTAHHTALKRSDAASTATPPARSSCKAPERQTPTAGTRKCKSPPQQNNGRAGQE